MAQQKPVQLECKEFLSVNDIAAIMNSNRTTVSKLLDKLNQMGELPVIHWGSSRRVRRVLFYEWLAQQDGYNPITGDRNFRVIRGRRRA